MPRIPKPKRESPKAKLRRLLASQRRSLQRRARPKSKGKPRFKNGRDPAKLAWIRQLRCDLFPISVRCEGPVEAAHVRSRGAGGTDAEVLPLCRWHHRQQHQGGIRTFEITYYDSVEGALQNRAAAYQRQYEKVLELGFPA